MNQTGNLADIAGKIETLTADLHKVAATVELLGKPAQLKADEIEAELQAAKDRFATALADQAVTERNRRLAGFSDISVEVRPGESLIDTGFVIRYTRDTWDIGLNKTVPKQHECNGFAALVDDAYEYLVTRKPEAIPAQIMALAPDNPHEAFSIYFTAKRRGYVIG
ncbi:hypothetical protein [uncultured Sphingomonas sp.]|uniref:hypothetical protein n=1 Tax=uncultured Sphingomonas sp. TaxID=158754 RepID=UPI0025837558|nr:hypothetical protein [uncultured Sphingomonas sp.]